MRKGSHHSQETKQKMSEVKRGTHASEETRKKMSAVHKGNKSTLGKHPSEETRKRMSEAQKGRIISEETRKRMSTAMVSKAMRGEKSYLWKGGITPINQKIRRSFEYRLWRKAVFERDHYTCIWCGKQGNIQADHIKRFSDYPELRFAIDNGRTLCFPCHRTTDTYGRKNSKKLQ